MAEPTSEDTAIVLTWLHENLRNLRQMQRHRVHVCQEVPGTGPCWACRADQEDIKLLLPLLTPLLAEVREQERQAKEKLRQIAEMLGRPGTSDVLSLVRVRIGEARRQGREGREAELRWAGRGGAMTYCPRCTVRGISETEFKLVSAEAENAALRDAIRDIDAHASPVGAGEVPDYYAVSVGSLHRALGLTGAAAKCQDLPCRQAAALRERVKELEEALRDILEDAGDGGTINRGLNSVQHAEALLAPEPAPEKEGA